MSKSRNGKLLLVSRIYCSSKESVIKQNIWAVKSLFFFTDLYCINLENGLDPAKVKIVPGTLFLLREIDYRQYFYCILSMRCLGHDRPSKSLQQCLKWIKTGVSLIFLSWELNLESMKIRRLLHEWSMHRNSVSLGENHLNRISDLFRKYAFVNLWYDKRDIFFRIILYTTK